MIRYEDRGPLRLMFNGRDSQLMLGLMLREYPFMLVGEYGNSMMAWILFEELSALSARHAMQLGLGPGVLTRYCHGKLGMRTTAVEIDPLVVTACRDWFLLAPDGEKLSVVVGDAREEIARQWIKGTVDALQVDLFDSEAHRPAVDDLVFWADCKASLTPTGCMVVNVYGHHCGYDPWTTIHRIQEVFGREAVWVMHPQTVPNLIVLARNAPMPGNMVALAAHAGVLEEKFRLPASSWLTRLQCPLAPASTAVQPGHVQ